MVVHIFKISDSLFQNFEVPLNVEYFESLKDICVQVKNTLKTHLETYNFSNLIIKLNTREFHTHDYTYFDVITAKEQKVFWVCSHN